jgi:hypothetical protein
MTILPKRDYFQPENESGIKGGPGPWHWMLGLALAGEVRQQIMKHPGQE